MALIAAACGGGGDDGNAAGDEHNGHTDDTVHDDTVEVDPADRCDLGFNTAEFNATAKQVGHFHGEDAPHMGGHHEVTYTIEEWAAVFADGTMGFNPETLAKFVHDTPQLKEAVTGGGLTGGTLEPDPWIPMTDPAACTTFAEELRRTRDAIAKYPTVADALAAGFTAGSQAAPGQGAHYTRNDWISMGDFNPDQPAQLMYDGQEPDSTLIGMAHLVLKPEGDDQPPDGFTGDNDRWHLHENLCRDDNDAAIGGDMTEEECAAIGGHFFDMVGGGMWMLHTWVVPGCESDWGMFSNANPKFPVRPPFMPFKSGCNSGTTIDQPLQLDTPGTGPDLNA
jgi:hypothetical protein